MGGEKGKKRDDVGACMGEIIKKKKKQIEKKNEKQKKKKSV